MPPPIAPEIAEQIRFKKSRYCRLADHNDLHSMDNVIAPDATFTFYNTDGSLMRVDEVEFKFDSRAAFAYYFSGMFKTMQTVHHVGPGELDQVAPDEVKAVWSFIYHCGAKGMESGRHETGGGYYHETWMREEGGTEWLMKQMRMERLYLHVVGGVHLRMSTWKAASPALSSTIRLNSTMNPQSCTIFSPSLCTLPIECRQAILCSLSSVATLKAAVLAHPALYWAFADRSEYIIRQIILHSIDPELLHDAVLAFSARSAKEDWMPEDVLAIFDQYQARQFPSSFRWTMQAASYMEELHQCIQFFISDFASSTLADTPRASIQPLSLDEWRRVARSFYQLEIHRLLFRYGNWDVDKREQWGMYYKRFYVWELEQMICASDYLFRRLAPLFNDIAAHDIEWAFRAVGYSLVEPWETAGQPTIMGKVLLQSLMQLKKIITAATYDEQYRLLTPAVTGHVARLPHDEMPVHRIGMDETTPLENYRPEDLERFPMLGVLDPNSGPSQVWIWSHMKMPAPDFVGGVATRELRRAGYVMWDSSRLEAMGFLTNAPFRIPPPLDIIFWGQPPEEAIQSILKRVRLYLMGARGWWAEDDESQVRWGKPCRFEDINFETQSFRYSITL
ncbi:uncharacterized protein KD926_002225 [Aspergillus affinis]|uniref:uncharacterized protein n=1 Tax=Aspergillus affinis TaxID=1070780 RepID=UPI0022FEA6B0|nr:uncharacterized protein KD926_002225 [Aspergillus affinis]KAI9036195.1 hypothetical protein KD926_002225 [Aspergillus affinis]